MELLLFVAAIAAILSLSSSQSPCYINGLPATCRPPRIDNIVSGSAPIASSTCGTLGRDRVCERSGLSCTECGADPASAHPPSLMTDGSTQTYWQSQTYRDIKDGVNITFNLGKTFSIDAISLTFYSPRPHSFSLYASLDYGANYFPLQFFSQSCLETYGMPATADDGSRTGPICVSDGVGLLPLTGGRAVFNSRSSTKATNIQLRLDRLSTLGNELTWNSTVLDSYWYALSDVAISGACFCNGHASSCLPDNNTSVRQCQCSHNTTGQDCQFCLSSHNDLLWSEATEEDGAIDCRECDCGGRSNVCRYDQSVFLRSGNLTGGVCQNCSSNTTGTKCQICSDGFYPNPSSQELECLSCICDPRGVIGSNGTCSSVTELYRLNGSCSCKSNVDGETCNSCVAGYFNLTTDGCQDCSCHQVGSLGNDCDLISGQCRCKSTLYFGRTCQPCDCHVMGTANVAIGCDSQGTCTCRDGVDGTKCDRCLPGYYSIEQGCLPCLCNVNGSSGMECDTIDGKCSCFSGYSGRDCSICPDGTHNIEEGCTDCPSCYDVMSEAFNQTVSELELLIIAINRTLVTVENDTQLVDLIGMIQFKLLELRELLRNLSMREADLHSNIAQVKEELNNRIEVNNVFSGHIGNAEIRARSLRGITLTNEATITGFNSQISSINSSLNGIAVANLSSALELVRNINLTVANLRDIANTVEMAALNQSEIVRRLVQETLLVADNTTDLLLGMCEVLTVENDTLILLRGLSVCSSQKLDLLLTEASVQLTDAADNATRALTEAFDSFNRVFSIQFNLNGSALLNRSIETLANANSLQSETLMVASTIDILRENLTSVRIEAEVLFSRATDLNRTAYDLLEREERAQSRANSTAFNGERIISETEELLSELQRRLQDVISFVDKLNRLTLLVEEAERASNTSLQQALDTEEQLTNIVNVVSLSDNLLSESIETLMKATEILMSANSTTIKTLSRAEQLLSNLSSIDLNSTNDSIMRLQERGERDSGAIERASNIVNTVVTDTTSVETFIEKLILEVARLESLLDSTDLQSPVQTLSDYLDQIEERFNNVEQVLASATSEIEELEAMSKTLREKYVNLQLHRDLLRDMRDNLADLDCERNFLNQK